LQVWNLRNHTSIKTLAGHDEKILAVDVAPGGEYIATASYDRTFKLWAPGSAF
jgi:U4/U6 small nuclear ribonucleoprotein PRP4